MFGVLISILKNGRYAIPIDERNAKYQEYLQWLAEGNVPDPPDPPPPPDDRPTLDDRLQAAETLINLILDEEAQ